mmetsp:Transcript_8103/g.25439  ORF Transcript_8103/g.25439 Transcript_8103/m.25439 type:complete len:208 (-) Transcript_8103:384-1007(-)
MAPNDLVKVPIMMSISRGLTPQCSHTPRPVRPTAPIECASSRYTYALYFLHTARIAGRFTISPSIEYTPSIMTRILVHGRRVRGWPSTTASRSTFSRLTASLWLNTRMRAPDARAPFTIDRWFSESEMIREPLPISAGTVVAFVPYPMLYTTASSTSRNCATSRSSSLWMVVVPKSERDDAAEHSKSSNVRKTSSRHVSFQSSANPR